MTPDVVAPDVVAPAVVVDEVDTNEFPDHKKLKIYDKFYKVQRNIKEA